MSPIQTDGASETTSLEYEVNDAADAFSKLWTTDEETPSDEDDKSKDDEKNKTQETAQNDPKDEDDTNTDDGEPKDEETPSEDGDEGEGEEASEDDKIIVKHTVDGKEKEFTLGQLKRLAGQEASLGRKSQEVAAARKAVDERAATQLGQLNVLLDRAKARWEPFSKIDFLAATKDPNISADELKAVRAMAEEAHADLTFLQGQTEQFTQALQNERRKELVEQARETVKVLSDPKTGIEGWNENLYGEIRKFAVESGLPEAMVNEIVDPNAIKLLNMARLYMKGKAQVTAAKPEKKAPKRIVKSVSTAVETKKTNDKTAGKEGAMSRLRNDGSVDSAAAAFEAQWAPQS